MASYNKLTAILPLIFILLAGCTDKEEVIASSEAIAIPKGLLPRTAEPKHYYLELHIDPNQSEFSGTTRIETVLHDDAKLIWLHGNRLNVQRVAAILPTGETRAAEYEQVDPIGVAKLTFAEALPRGEVTLTFDYTAPFDTNLEGLHKVTSGGDNYAFTQFEATSARLAFPSFDEPGFKVPFDITLHVPAELKAVTNTPVQKESSENGTRNVQFQTTKPLPTYLIAFAVGPLDEVVWDGIPASAVRAEPIPLRGFTARGKGDQIRYALEHTAEIVLGLENYFGVAYPYSKLDILALPDFAAGAMENAGSITYREQLLLMDENAPAAQKLRYASVHAHELAHQWFGDLVTPQWWDDIWLNEAFATWMAGTTMHRLQPDLGYDQRTLSAALNSMQLDQLVSARQIRQPVTQHQDIGAAFDGITYQKGGAVIAMIERFVGPENFRQGITNYLNEFRFSNANAQDFVRSIAATRPDMADGLIEQAFFSFLEQPGTPLLAMNWECTNGNTSVSVSQQRYLPLGSSGDHNRQWVLPLCVTAVNGNVKQTHCTIVQEQHAQFDLAATSDTCPDTLIPNADAAGYYRFSLNADNWQSLLSNDQLSKREQLSAADSLSAAFYAGEVNADDFVNLLPALLKSDNAQVLTAPLNELALMYREMLTEKQRPLFSKKLDGLYEHVYASVQLDKTLRSPDEIQLRNTLLRLYANTIKDPGLREQLRNKAIAYTGYNSDQKIHPDALDVNIREVSLGVAAEMEGKPFVDLLHAHFNNSSDALLREELLRAMTATDDPAVLDELRELSLSESIRDNEVGQILNPLMTNIDKRDATWQWLRAHLDHVIARQPDWTKGGVINYASGFCSQERYDEIKNDLAEKFSALESGPRSLANTLERIQLCSALVDKHKTNVQKLVGD